MPSAAGLCRATGRVVLVALLAAACTLEPAVSEAPPSASPTAFDVTGLKTCRDAFAAWVGGSGALNTPGTDPIQLVVDMELVQVRVFELCSLAEAEALNAELQIEDVPGTRRSLIEPDMATFARGECVDEAPLLAGTALCAEMSR